MIEKKSFAEEKTKESCNNKSGLPVRWRLYETWTATYANYPRN